MPYREVRLHRWQVAAAFVAQAIVCVVSVWIGTHASNQATHASNQATDAALQAKSAVRAIKKTNARVAEVREDQLYNICAYANENNRRIVDYLVKNTRQGERRRAAAEAAFPQITNCGEFASKGKKIKKATVKRPAQ